MDQVIHVRLENKPGALMRVAGILTATGTNIESLVLSPDAYEPGVSNMTIVADVEPRLRERVVQQINRLVNVFAASDITSAPDGGGGGRPPGLSGPGARPGCRRKRPGCGLAAGLEIQHGKPAPKPLMLLED